MKYKAEVVKNGRVSVNRYFHKLTHPKQVVRNLVTSLKGKMDYFIIFIVNDDGEMWKYSVMKRQDGKLYIRDMVKGSQMFTRDDLDMIFTGNKTISGGFL